jgi:hypothetical protein
MRLGPAGGSMILRMATHAGLRQGSLTCLKDSGFTHARFDCLTERRRAAIYGKILKRHGDVTVRRAPQAKKEMQQRNTLALLPENQGLTAGVTMQHRQLLLHPLETEFALVKRGFVASLHSPGQATGEKPSAAAYQPSCNVCEPLLGPP